MGKRCRDDLVEERRSPHSPRQVNVVANMKSASATLTSSATSTANAAVYGRNKRPSPNSAIDIDPQPNKRRPEPLHSSSSSHQPVASTSSPSPSPVTRPILRRTQGEKEEFAKLEPEYRDEVRAYMYDLEGRTMANVELIDMQPELQWYMRPYLVDFLIEVHQQHALRPETLYLAMNIVDRYVSKRIVFKKHYQLVGCAALWIAAKFEDAKDRVPTVQDLCQSCCGAYEESAFVQMEGHVLSTIGWVIGHPTAEAWLRVACVQLCSVEDHLVQAVARLVMEVTLFHRGFIAFKPSDVAAGALTLARCITGRPAPAPRPFCGAPVPIGDAGQALAIATLLDGHFADHLEQVSQIVMKKYTFGFYQRSAATVREFYLNGGRFSLPLPPSTPSKPTSGNSSSPLYTRGHASFADMSPGSEGSSSGSEADESSECDYDEPITPITPMSSCSLVNPMDALATQTPARPPMAVTTGEERAGVAAEAPMASGSSSIMVEAGKENLPRSVAAYRPMDACAAPLVRLALNEWDANANAMSI